MLWLLIRVRIPSIPFRPEALEAVEKPSRIITRFNILASARFTRLAWAALAILCGITLAFAIQLRVL